MINTLILLALNALATAALYLSVPAILCLTNRKLTQPQIKKVTIINGAVIWLALQIYYLNIGVSHASAAVILWSAVAHALLKKFCLKNDVEESQFAEPAPSGKAASKRYSNCGKQYFHPKKFFNAFAHIISIAVIIALLFALFSERQNHQAEVEQYLSIIEDLERKCTSEESNPADHRSTDNTFVVLIEQSAHYHNFNCFLLDHYQDEKLQFVSQEVAENSGHTPCSWCCE